LTDYGNLKKGGMKSWPFEEISIFSHGGHLGYRKALMDIFLKGNHPRINSAKFG
jgi:hypothetical protein